MNKDAAEKLRKAYLKMRRTVHGNQTKLYDFNGEKA